jgi:hypothetical protein
MVLMPELPRNWCDAVSQSKAGDWSSVGKLGTGILECYVRKILRRISRGSGMLAVAEQVFLCSGGPNIPGTAACRFAYDVVTFSSLKPPASVV